ncbi:MAG: acyl carrier protein [Acidimicrobiia bacterium]
MASIQDQIREHIISEFNASTDISDETRLIDTEVIDSLGIFLLVNFLQERFGVEVDPEEVTLDNFESVSAMAELVSSKRLAS